MKNKIDALRDLMKKHGVQAYFIPGTDPHHNEYVPEFWQRRQFLSGFSGSAGDLVVTMAHAGLWTDSRYYLQAEQQLNPAIFTLFKTGMPDVPTWKEWLKLELRPGNIVGLDPKVISHRDYNQLKSELEFKGIIVKSIDENLVDAIQDNRPLPSRGKITVLDEAYTGESIISKLNRLRQQLTALSVQAQVIPTLDAIAWLFNIRGSDISFNPVVISYAIVTHDKATLFVDLEKVTSAVANAFRNLVAILPYDGFNAELIKLAQSKCRVLLDSDTVNQAIVDSLEGAELVFKSNPITMLKAIKNPTEIAGMKAAHIRDGVAMVKFLNWLDEYLTIGAITEISAAEKLTGFRRQGDKFKGLSFETISAYADHGAIIHYAVTPESCYALQPDGLYLIDSGGQYLDGTTDITRTIALGATTAEQKDRFTRVLKGMIRLSMTAFPGGTAGKQLDTIARESLWQRGLNYGHGTGHGVGAYLNVHEGPQAISFYRCTGIGLEPGMIVTNEPGYYKTGDYGIRIENMLVVVPAPEKTSAEFTFYKFETLTLCPIDICLVQKNLLSQEEIDWLNDYHNKVCTILTPWLDQKESNWLQHATRAI